MRVIKLTHGSGNGIDSACLMTASNMLIGRGEDGDSNSCVCPVIRDFVIRTNDAMPIELLGELYGPLTWEILGTRTDDRGVVVARALRLADWAVRDACGIDCAPIVDAESAARAATAARARADAARAARADAAWAARAAAAAARADAAWADAAWADAARAAAWAARAAEAAADVWRKCPDIIRELAAIGDTRPKEPACVITPDQLRDALSEST